MKDLPLDASSRLYLNPCLKQYPYRHLNGNDKYVQCELLKKKNWIPVSIIKTLHDRYCNDMPLVQNKHLMFDFIVINNTLV
jgi:hypothetical protein